MLQFAVIGDPIEQSLSPVIHAAFAEQLGIELNYTRQRVTPETFAHDVSAFFTQGGRGLNVTTPLKDQAFAYADLLSDRAMNAGAANTLAFLDNDVVLADNTDGRGLVRDLRHHKVTLSGKNVVLLGAGGAARGCVQDLLAEQPAALFVHNRTEDNARRLIAHSARLGAVQWLADATTVPAIDVVINATSASLYGHRPDIDAALLAGAACYDLTYGANAQPFVKWALASGATAAFDGLGMLIEQAAVSFQLWHDVLPDTAPVREQLSALKPHSR